MVLGLRAGKQEWGGTFGCCFWRSLLPSSLVAALTLSFFAIGQRADACVTWHYAFRLITPCGCPLGGGCCPQVAAATDAMRPRGAFQRRFERRATLQPI